jgi:hypothetical protein
MPAGAVACTRLANCVSTAASRHDDHVAVTMTVVPLVAFDAPFALDLTFARDLALASALARDLATLVTTRTGPHDDVFGGSMLVGQRRQGGQADASDHDEFFTG